MHLTQWYLERSQMLAYWHNNLDFGPAPYCSFRDLLYSGFIAWGQNISFPPFHCCSTRMVVVLSLQENHFTSWLISLVPMGQGDIKCMTSLKCFSVLSHSWNISTNSKEHNGRETFFNIWLPFKLQTQLWSLNISINVSQREVLLKQMRCTLIHTHLCTEAYTQGALTFPEDHTSYLGIGNAYHSDDSSAFLLLYHSIPEEKERNKSINQMVSHWVPENWRCIKIHLEFLKCIHIVR